MRLDCTWAFSVFFLKSETRVVPNINPIDWSARFRSADPRSYMPVLLGHDEGLIVFLLNYYHLFFPWRSRERWERVCQRRNVRNHAFLDLFNSSCNLLLISRFKYLNRFRCLILGMHRCILLQSTHVHTRSGCLNIKLVVKSKSKPKAWRIMALLTQVFTGEIMHEW